MRRMAEAAPLVGIIMGSKSDWDTMRHADEMLTRFDVAHECRVLSAHRTPALTAEYASTAAGRGLEVIIAGAGGAAHLAGVVAAHTLLPVIGVPVQSAALNGLDSLLSTVQMPKGIPVATVAIGASGAANAGLLAVAILATSRPTFARNCRRTGTRWRRKLAGKRSNYQLPVTVSRRRGRVGAEDSRRVGPTAEAEAHGITHKIKWKTAARRSRAGRDGRFSPARTAGGGASVPA